MGEDGHSIEVVLRHPASRGLMRVLDAHGRVDEVIDALEGWLVSDRELTVVAAAPSIGHGTLVNGLRTVA